MTTELEEFETFPFGAPGEEVEFTPTDFPSGLGEDVARLCGVINNILIGDSDSKILVVTPRRRLAVQLRTIVFDEVGIEGDVTIRPIKTIKTVKRNDYVIFYNCENRDGLIDFLIGVHENITFLKV